MPDGREEFYGYNVLKEVFQYESQIKFYIVANSNANLFSEFENVEVMGTLSLVQMEELYDKISIVIRNVKHECLLLKL